MRIAFIIPRFGAGGAERVGSLLCNAWASAGHRVTAITFEACGAEPAFPLDRRVEVRQIDALNTSETALLRIATNIRRLRVLRKAIQTVGPDVIVTFTTEANVVALWAAAGLAIPILVSERNQPDRPGLGQWRALARRLSYPFADGIVVQTDLIADWARARFRVPVRVLPNPVRLPREHKKCRSEGDMKQVIAVGRLVRQKGFDVLIESFAKIADRHPNWRLQIYGEGVERESLQAQIRKSPCPGRIQLMGLADDMNEVYASANLFVLSSRYEGYPNVLLEALAAGCPVVATNCPGATREILRAGRYGVLVDTEDLNALADALNRVLSDETLRSSLGCQAREAVAELDVDAVASRWVDLFNELRG